jgi:hypothetical protein
LRVVVVQFLMIEARVIKVCPRYCPQPWDKTGAKLSQFNPSCLPGTKLSLGTKLSPLSQIVSNCQDRIGTIRDNFVPKNNDVGDNLAISLAFYGLRPSGLKVNRDFFCRVTYHEA